MGSHDNDPDIIPKILYQTWKSNDIPDHLQAYRDTWLDTHRAGGEVIPRSLGSPPRSLGSPPRSPGWSHKFLLDEDLRNLVKDNFPKYLSHYDNFTFTIERVDFARYVMMYLGGVYADIDTYPVKKIDPYLKYPIVLGREPLDHAHRLYNREVVLCNAFMMSEGNKNPKVGEFWIRFMDYIIENYEHNSQPVYTTGPMAMTLFYESNKDLFDSANVLITDPCVFFPMQADNTISKECDFDAQTYVVHVWENSWSKPLWQNPVFINSRYWFWGLLFIFAGVWMYSYCNYRKRG